MIHCCANSVMVVVVLFLCSNDEKWRNEFPPLLVDVRVFNPVAFLDDWRED